ncbi:hypothetical protein GCM10011588_11300 [Nocardia jinanensis]|uniref:Uncharacterized protein n=1 Tax=Nocardia jinanensis TaxID=382504 RepID=A0A917VNC2_9NOCA|nr:hypothetical protein GCM10011588_11300 [Nocardia jinanensis]
MRLGGGRERTSELVELTTGLRGTQPDPCLGGGAAARTQSGRDNCGKCQGAAPADLFREPSMCRGAGCGSASPGALLTRRGMLIHSALPEHQWQPSLGLTGDHILWNHLETLR